MFNGQFFIINNILVYVMFLRNVRFVTKMGQRLDALSIIARSSTIILVESRMKHWNNFLDALSKHFCFNSTHR